MRTGAGAQSRPRKTLDYEMLAERCSQSVASTGWIHNP